MMKYVLFISIAVVGLILSACAGISSKTTEGAAVGSFTHFEKYFTALAQSENDDAFLIAVLSDTEDFFQFKHYTPGVFEIDFPLITERQQSLENQVISAHKLLGLKYEIVEGADGSRFIDVYTKSNAKDISEIVTSLYEYVYFAEQSRKLDFMWSGFDLKEPANHKINADGK